MKRVLALLFILTIGFMLVGCEKKNNDWVIDLTDSKQEVDSGIKYVFESYNGNLEYVALLSKQVVAGTNYMFLCKDDKGYKIAIVYKDLENKAQITSVNDFDPIEYLDKNIELDNEQLSGGWYVEIPENKMKLSDEVQGYFDKAIKTLTGATYYPIAVLAHKENNGTNYAVLCYGEGSYVGSTAGIYMITLHVENDKVEISSIAGIDVKKYNK